MSEALPLASRIRFGVMAAATDREQARQTIDAIAGWGYEVVWIGDHVAFTGPISDPLLQLTYFSALRPELTYGTSIYLLPLRHPTPVAKMVATLDRLMGAGHFIFGIGVGGEFPPEFEACGVPVKERGGRATEAMQVVKRLWTEPSVEHRGRYFNFGAVRMEPKPATPGGPPIWVGGRAEAALKRAARYGDGWMPYVVTPRRIADGLEFIAREAERAGRKIERFGTSLHAFVTLGKSYEAALDVAAEHLSRRYAMDFREPAKKYAVIGTPADVAERLGEFIKAGARDIGVDAICHPRDRDALLEQFAKEVIPLIRKG
ncbi:MAG TPA: LLM class flavin-dependent oxidoreductase [Candidatus Binataceae bacterium]|nr:LLM class flavin-dependent oxidoreductase [Candidatus Binataceae bacterium]